MNLRNRLAEEQGQGLVEYTVIVLFVVLMVWLGVKYTNADDALAANWNTITGCVGSPLSCNSGS
jgi:Flp pilus assembly pilin Flp